MNEALDSIICSLKKSPYGSVIGGVAGFYLTRKFVSKSNWSVIPITIASVVIGSIIEYRIRDAFGKTDEFNKGLTTPKVEVKNAK